MSKIILNCKSIFSRKISLKCNFSNNFIANKEILKISNSNINCYRFSNNKINSNKKISTRIKINGIYKKSPFLLKIKNNILEQKCYEYKITNQEIINNIDDFYKLTKIYINLFLDSNQIYINNGIDSIFIVLKFHENNIIDLKEYSKKDINKIFTRELIYKLEFL